MSMQTIPQDIAADIFVHCLSAPIEHLLRPLPDLYGMRFRLLPDPPDPPHPHTAPLVLLHVCRAWRYLALATPRLWTELSLSASELPASLRDAEALRTLVGEWFSRAGFQPLSFSARGFRHFPAISLKKVLPALPDHQLQTLHLSCVLGDLDGIPALALGSLPLLDTLVLQLRWDVGVERPPGITALPPIAQVLLDSPKLQRLFLRFELAVTMRSPSPRPMLATASLFFIQEKDLLDFLRSAPTLVQLECQFADYSRPFPDEPMITHHHLKILRLHLTSGCNAPRILPHLCLPALEVMEITEGVALRANHLKRFLSHCSHTLRRLSDTSDHRSSFSAGFDLALLDNLHGLTHIELHHIDRDLYLLFHRLDRNAYPDILPQLRSFVVMDVIAGHDDLTALADTLSSRSRVGGSLEPFLDCCHVVYADRTALPEWTWFYQRSFTPELVEAFHALMNAGMEIFLGPPRNNKLGTVEAGEGD
ncbi:hypothetical protein C8F01DRAFT_1360453 [Mycena amicta]|nr:hypothetical protein C8F01DRAFT_1360453 [Mycena amicta]